MAVLMPITSPWAFKRGPPELPGFIAASVWIKLTRLSGTPTWVLVRSVALMIPIVTVLSKPKGLPIAIAHCPAIKFCEFPNFTVGNLSAAILTTATSVIVSIPTTLPSKIRPSLSVTCTVLVLSTT